MISETLVVIGWFAVVIWVWFALLLVLDRQTIYYPFLLFDFVIKDEAKWNENLGNTKYYYRAC